MSNIILGLGNKKIHRGYAIWQGEGAPIERDTFTCKHCCRVIFLSPGESIPGGCSRCGGMICEQCIVKGTCTPYLDLITSTRFEIEKRLETERMLEKVGIK